VKNDINLPNIELDDWLLSVRNGVLTVLGCF